MAGDDAALGVDQDRRIESELRNAARYLCDLRVRMPPGVLGVWSELSELPMLDALRHCLRKHSSPSKWRFVVEVPFGGCALRSPVEPSLCFLFYIRTSSALYLYMYKLRATRHYFGFLFG